MDITTTVLPDGTWTAQMPEGQSLPVGTYSVRAKQSVNGIESDYSAAQTLTIRAYDADAKAWVNTLSVPPSQAYIDRINNLVTGLKAAALWSKAISLFDHAAATQQARLLNIRNPATLPATLVNSPTFNALGYAGDGVSAYIRYGRHEEMTGFNADNGAVIVVSSDLAGTAMLEDAGIWGSNASAGISAVPANSAGIMRSRFSQGVSTFDDTSGTRTSGLGLMALSRTDAAGYRRYRSSGLIDSPVRAPTGSFPAGDFTVRGLYGSPGYSRRTLSFAGHFQGLTDAEMLSCIGLLKAFYTNTGVTV